MLNTTLTKLTDKIKTALPKVEIIYLFGSQATASAGKESDYDLAVLLPVDTNVNELMIFNLQQELASLVNSDVDLIFLNKASLVLKFQVISSGIVLYSKQEKLPAVFEMTVLSMYQRFNEERKDILLAVASSQSIYGGR